MTCDPVSVSRTIEAPADKLFGLLTHSANHPLIDGSGMLREAPSDVVLSRVGDVFAMRMHNDEMGDYEMSNHVGGIQSLQWSREAPQPSRPGRPSLAVSSGLRLSTAMCEQPQVVKAWHAVVESGDPVLLDGLLADDVYSGRPPCSCRSPART